MTIITTSPYIIRKDARHQVCKKFLGKLSTECDNIEDSHDLIATGSHCAAAMRQAKTYSAQVR